jgi:hypothetical protein
MAKRFSVSVKDKDLGFDKMIRGAESFLKQPYIKVGVIGDSGHSEGLTVVDIATFHEFGTETVPQRSFVRSTVDANIDQIRAKQKDLIDAVLFRGADLRRELGLIGLDLQGKMQKRIKDRIPPPNAESTIRAKGSDVPLIDTGQLWRSISYEVGVE